MPIDLLDTLDNEDNREIPQWRSLLVRIDEVGGRTDARQAFVDAHANTIRCVGAADYHYHILNQVYIPDVVRMGSLTTLWVQIEAESIVIALYSALDSLMQEINLACNFGVRENGVSAYHPEEHRESPNTHTRCVRCKLSLEDDSLGRYLNEELTLDWFDKLRRLRNRIAHRRLIATNTNLDIGRPTTYIEMPSDPEANRFTEIPRRGIEINSYCASGRADVARTIGNSYELLAPRIRGI